MDSGITGDRGGGSYRTLRKFNSKALIVCGSLGKGFGISGGAICSSKSLINKFMDTGMFGASGPAPPYGLATFLQAQALYAQKTQYFCFSIVHFFKEKVHDLSHFRYLDGYPVFNYTDDTLSGHLLKHGIVVTNFRYPNDDSGTIRKIVLSAHHTHKDMAQLIHTINRYPTRHPR